MEYNTLLFTRTMKEDYCWHMLPKGLSSLFAGVMPGFIRLREGLGGEEIDWMKTVFFFRFEGMNVAVRILENGTDYVGRRIYSLEGFASRNLGMRSRLTMPDLVNWFREHSVSFAELEARGLLPTELETEDVINPLLPLTLVEADWEDLSQPGFRKLISVIREDGEDYGFVMGPEADRVYRAVASWEREGRKLFRNFYRMSTEGNEVMDTEDGQRSSNRDYVPVRPRWTLEKKELQVFIRFGKTGRKGGSYQWLLRRNDGAVMKSRKINSQGRISLGKLAEEYEILKIAFGSFGYRIV